LVDPKRRTVPYHGRRLVAVFGPWLDRMASRCPNISAGLMAFDTIARPDGPLADTAEYALSALTTLFLLWGFITCLNDILA